jgi:RNA polymerase sigma-70 factor (ECF subfamily)
MGTIVQLFQRQRSDSFEALLAPHIEHLYRLAWRFCGNRADAEDLVQDLLVKLYARRAELTGMDYLRPWLVRTLYNLFIDSVRRAGRNPLTGAGGEDALRDLEVVPERDAEDLLLQQRLQQALLELNPDQRSLIALHDIEDYTLPELEQLLDTPIGTLKSRLHRARARLRELLAMEPSEPRQRLVN